MVLVWSGLVRTTSPWLMSLVQAVAPLPLLALPAKGLLWVSACGVHAPSRLVAVNERKKRPRQSCASTIMRYWFLPWILYTSGASNRLAAVSLMIFVDDEPKLLGKLPMGMSAR